MGRAAPGFCASEASMKAPPKRKGNDQAGYTPGVDAWPQ